MAEHGRVSSRERIQSDFLKKISRAPVLRRVARVEARRPVRKLLQSPKRKIMVASTRMAAGGEVGRWDIF